MKKYIPFLLLLLINFFSSTAFGQVIYTIAGGDTAGYSGDGGPAINAKISTPRQVVLDKYGNLYIGEIGNECVRKITPAYNGIINTIAGTGGCGYWGDSGVAIKADLCGPQDIAISSKGDIFIADLGNNRIRKIDVNGIITTVAGNGTAGYNGDSIQAITAELNAPTGVAVDSQGNLYIADWHNYRIRKVDTAGIITTIAGIGIKGLSTDSSLADTSRLNAPFCIRLDKSNNIFFGDSAFVKKIDTAGYLTTIAGNGTGIYNGDSEAIKNGIGVDAIDLDSLGNIYVCDGSADKIFKITLRGTQIAIAGGGSTLGDGGDPLKAWLYVPQGVAVNNEGDVFIGDTGHNRVRLVTSHLSVSEVNDNEDMLVMYPNPCQGQFSIRLSTKLKQAAEMNISGVDGKIVYHAQFQTNETAPIITGLPAGFYIISISTEFKHFNNKLIIQ